MASARLCQIILGILMVIFFSSLINAMTTGSTGNRSDREILHSEWIDTDWRNVQASRAKGPKLFPARQTIRVGIIMPKSTASATQGKVSFANSVGAISLALERIETEQLLPGANFTFVWRFGECKDTKIIGHLIDMMKHENVTVLIEPPCFQGALVSSVVLKRYNVPRLGWSAMGSDLSNKTRFAGRTSTFGSPIRMSYAVKSLLLHYQWRRIAMIYGEATGGHCHSVAERLHRLLPVAEILNAYNFAVDRTPVKDADIEKFLDLLAQTARIAIVCFDDDSDALRLMTKASRRGMTSNEYLYIILDYQRDASSAARADIGMDLGAFKNAVFLDVSIPNGDNVAAFKRELIRRTSEWPFYYSSAHQDDQYASSYSPFLHDTFYLYALALNETMKQGGSIDDHILVINKTNNAKFNGRTGRVEMDERGERKTKYLVTGYDKKMDLVEYAEINLDHAAGGSVKMLITDAMVVESRGAWFPSDTPACGFLNEKCDTRFSTLHLTIAGSVIAGVVMISMTMAMIFFIQRRIAALQRAKGNWRIEYRDIDWMSASKRRASFLWTLTDTKFEKHSTDGDQEALNTARYGNATVWVKKHEINAVFHSASDHLHLNAMREFKHENINQFIGLCVDTTVPISLWGLAVKGSLEDIIENETLRLDSFFKYLLIRDLTNGMEHLHSSDLKSHGRLRSANCVIDASWALKITDYGLHKIRAPKIAARDKLWVAPEFLRLLQPPIAGTQKGDVYSFAIIVQEIVTCNKPYCNDKLSDEETIFRVRNVEVPPFRPTIKGGAKENDIDDGLLQVMKDCWNENPQMRPDFKTIKATVRQLYRGRSTNLMDHVLKTMEKYAVSLEEVVADRMKQLSEETRKTEQLLCRLLPKLIAEKLKSGHSVEAECYDYATILFSDVVGFTQIAARSSPMEIVNLLNELYTLFDDIIALYDVYKGKLRAVVHDSTSRRQVGKGMKPMCGTYSSCVSSTGTLESVRVVTIGDGYMCASGLPIRNGNRHASEMADMALHVVSAMKTFRIPHMQNEKMEVRIGIHTGAVVAGIVGITMPRYCVFGDTVNTAGRLEGSGKGSAIHISDITNSYLTEIIGGYITKPRGEVILKGRGVIFTYWLLGKTGHSKVMITYPNEGTSARELISGRDTGTNLVPVENVE